VTAAGLTVVDVVVVGAGIVGAATAHAVLDRRPHWSVVVVDKEPGPARHQTGRNSGVIHSGIYYRPDSDKRHLVARGRHLLESFATDHGIPFERCGKVVVAQSADELGRLTDLEDRARANDIATERLGPAGIADHEPHVVGHAALHVPVSGIIDYSAVTEALLDDASTAGAEVRYGCEVLAVDDGLPRTVRTSTGPVRTRRLVNCGGLHADRVAQLAGADTADVRIMPFRGEYRDLAPSARHLVRNLVYPVPDPAFPFLGVHLTRGINGAVHAGPNAVPALAREGYRWRDVNRRDLAEIVTARSTWQLARRHWRMAAAEIRRSIDHRAFVRSVQGLCPEIGADDLLDAPAGVRAQAIDAGGELLDDFAFAGDDHTVHVLNAPSPAATASLAIGERIAERLTAG